MRVVAAHVVSGDKNDILLLDSVSLDDTPFELPPEREVTPEAYLPSFVSYHLFHNICVAKYTDFWSSIIAQLEAGAEAGYASIEGTNKTRHNIYIHIEVLTLFIRIIHIHFPIRQCESTFLSALLLLQHRFFALVVDVSRYQQSRKRACITWIGATTEFL
jgi:hypothetical protein